LLSGNHPATFSRLINRYVTVGKKALSGLAVSRIVKEALTRAGIDFHKAQDSGQIGFNS
jgi:hypothetical protein